MHAPSITKAIMVSLLASAPLAAAFGAGDVVAFEKRHVGSLASYASKVVRAAIPEVLVEKREPHHTEAQIAAKEAAAAGGSSGSSRSRHGNNKRQAPDEFGPWDSTEDEFGSWVDKREAHHTEAQIAAKEAATAGGSTGSSRSRHGNNKRQAPDEFGPWDSTEDEFGSWVDKREPHHTEAQIAAKEAAAAAGSTGSSRHGNNKRHHTEAQIAAKEAAAGGSSSSSSSSDSSSRNCRNNKRHHTEAQIAAKEAAAGSSSSSSSSDNSSSSSDSSNDDC